VTQSVPDWEPYTQAIAPEGTPNVLYIVLDDVGYSAMEPYGGLIETPNIDRIAQRGLTYTNFHTTALCSPTRSCLMTGRNHTTNGMATITEAASGFPSSNGHIPFECATIAEVLGERGWNTEQLGKLAGGLAARNVPLGLAHVHGPALDMAERSGLLASVGADHVFPTTPAAVAWAQLVADAPAPRQGRPAGPG